jgi:hypothetical protein
MARYYANTGGRFNSPDKGALNLSVPASLNRYSYARLDPVNHTDRSGNQITEQECRDMGLIPVVVSPGGRVGEDTFPPIIECRFPDTDLPGQPVAQPSPQREPGVFYSFNDQAKLDQVIARARQLRTALTDPSGSDCLSFLGGDKFLGILDDALANNKFMVGVVGQLVDRGSNSLDIDWKSLFGLISLTPDLQSARFVGINTNGAFWDSTQLAGITSPGGGLLFRGGSAAAQLYVLMHELAHASGAPDPDDSANQQAWADKCGNVLRNAQ